MVQLAEDKPGLLGAAMVTLILSIVAFVAMPAVDLYGQPGICFPPPSQWAVPGFFSWLLNLAVIFALAGALIVFNNSFNFIPTPGVIYASAFMLMTAGMPMCLASLNTAVLLGAASLFSLGTIFALPDRGNGARGMFLVASTLSLGALFQYSFLLMLPAFVASAIVMKRFRAKEIIATVFGLAAPLVIVLGFGFISPEELRMPHLNTIFSDNAADLWTFAGCMGVTAVGALSLMAVNSMNLYSAKSSVRIYNTCFMLFGLNALLLMILDFDNAPAYTVTFFIFAAGELGNYFATHRSANALAVLAGICIFYTVIFFCLL